MIQTFWYSRDGPTKFVRIVKIVKKNMVWRDLKKMLDLEIIPEKAITTDNWEIV